MDSSGVWISLISGPKEIQSSPGILSANRPHSKPAWMVWTTGFEGVRRLRFGGDEIRFFDIFGKEFFPTRGEDGGYDIFVSGSPVYFAGGTLEEPFSSVQ